MPRRAARSYTRAARLLCRGLPRDAALIDVYASLLICSMPRRCLISDATPYCYAALLPPLRYAAYYDDYRAERATAQRVYARCARLARVTFMPGMRECSRRAQLSARMRAAR